MRPLAQAEEKEFASVRFVLTDMDETLTYQGRLHAATYSALERLRDAGLIVIPVTAAPAGWCDQMARMWPVSGVIGENGGFFFRSDPNGHDLKRTFWHSAAERDRVEARLKEIARAVQSVAPGARMAQDQPYRLTSVAFVKPDDADLCATILDALKSLGADTTVNNLWVLGWIGGYDKLSMARRTLAQSYNLNIDDDQGAVLYSGDSTNDAPMFAFFRHTVGVSTVRNYLSEISTPPSWITQGPGGSGFVEIAEAILQARAIS